MTVLAWKPFWKRLPIWHFKEEMHRVSSLVSEFFADWAVRNGIKFALAGTISLFFALWMRLDKPSWAVTTAFVLSTPKFVGAIAEKTVFRIFGAALGAVTGYVITGSLEQNPILFLLAVGGFVSFTTTMYGGKCAPYFFRQWGYTATIVAAQGMLEPSFSWKVGLARFEEILLGIIIATAVTTVVWPRYARVEFACESHATLRKLRRLLAERMQGFLTNQLRHPPEMLNQIGAGLAKLRKLIRLGSFESRAFRARRDKVDAIVSELGTLSNAISNFGQSLPSESILRPYMEEAANALHEALLEGLDTLASPRVSDTERKKAVARVKCCLEAYMQTIERVRLDGAGEDLSIEESLEHAGYSFAVHEIYDSMEHLEVLFSEMDSSQIESFPTIQLEPLNLPSREWIHSGLKGGIAVILGLIILNWFQPPGGDMVVVGAYLFSAFTLESSDRKGDLGVFTTFLWMALTSLGFFFFLLLITPALSSYLVMNVVLAGALFIVGYFTEIGKFGSFQSLFCLLLIVNLVGINAQEPVPFQSIVGAVVGLFLSSLISALIRRLIWPVLPQLKLREQLHELFAFLQEITSGNPKKTSILRRAHFVLSIAEAYALAQVLRGNILSEKNTECLRSYLAHLSKEGAYLLAFPWSALSPLSKTLQEEMNATLELLRKQVAERIAWEQSLGTGNLSANHPPLSPAFLEWASETRHKIRAEKLPVPATVAAIGLLHYGYEIAKASDASVLENSRLPFPTFFLDRCL